MNKEILTLDGYPIGWGWLQNVPLKDWEWLIEVFATMTDNDDTYSYIAYEEEEGAKLTKITNVRTIGLAKFLYEDQGYYMGIRYYGYYLIAKSMGIKSEKEFVERYREILSIINE